MPNTNATSSSTSSRESHDTQKKRKLIEEHEEAKAKGRKVSHAELALKYGFKDRSTVTKILKNKDTILKLSDQQLAQGQSRVRQVKSEKLEACVTRWVDQTLQLKNAKAVLTGKLIQEKALDFARILQITDFKASSGWLTLYKDRHGLKWREFHGEAASAPLGSLTAERKILQALLKHYVKRNIFNADETGLYWRATPKRGLVKGKTSGFKKDKARVTLLLCSNADGSEKLKPFVIGTSQAPQPFPRGTKLRHHHQVSYTNNSTAWMNSEKWEDWLREIDSMMRIQQREILLLVDNFSGHSIQSDWTPTNVKVHFLPPNTTAHLQPMDAGIISAFKRKYSAMLSRHWVDALDHLFASSSTSTSPTEADIKLVTLVNMRMVFGWVKQAWDDISPVTIANCWRHTGILPDTWPVDEALSEKQQAQDKADETQEAAEILAMLKHPRVDLECGSADLTVAGYLSLGDELDEQFLEDDAAIVAHCTQEEDPEEEIQEVAPPIKLASAQELRKSITQLKLWVQFGGEDADTRSLRALEELDRSIFRQEQARQKQTSITSFFKPVSES